MTPEKQRLIEDLAAQFAVPSPEYSPVPIWWWSGDRLERQRLRWQMEQLVSGGVHNVVIMNLAPTSPLYGADADDPPFLSEAWWEIFLGMCEDARAIGMRVWFYDQIGFSGANLQGEIVRAEPSYAGQVLSSITAEGDGALALECPSEGMPLAASWTALDEAGNPQGKPVALALQGRSAHVDETGSKRLRLIYALRRGFDYFNPKACDRLLDVIHYEFERRASQYFGDVIVGSFQDELPSMLSWSETFAQHFQAIKHYDLFENITALFEGDDPDSERVRVDYHQVRALLAEEAFFKPLFDWHEKNGLICGFDQQGPARGGEPISTVQKYADYMQTHRWFGAPGSDHHGHAKIHSSLAHLYGRPRVWIEAFHTTGWGGTLEETFDWLLPWLQAGATLYDPHAVYYSTHGGWFEWAPPSTCWRQPYWRHYPVFSKAVSRLCFMLSQGHHVCDIGVLYPTTTVQAGCVIDEALTAARSSHDILLALTGRMMFLEGNVGVMDANKRDYDILDDHSIQHGNIIDGRLQVGAEHYRVIILPGCKVLESATADQLIRFVEAGGRLITVGQIPDNIVSQPGGQLEKLRSLFASGDAVQLDSVDQLADVLDGLSRAVEAPVPTLHRRIDGMDVVFVPAAFPNVTEPDPNNAGWLYADYDFHLDRYQRPMRVIARGFDGTPQLWDPVSGERRAVDVTPQSDGSQEIVLSFASAPAALLVWSAEGSSESRVAELPSRILMSLPDEWACEIEQTLDNRYGDLDKPDAAAAPPVQTWAFEHRMASTDDEAIEQVRSAADWTTVTATFGAYGWISGVRPVAELPEPLKAIPNDGSWVDGDWTPAVYSLQRGILKDDLHIPTLGPKGHVPEEFLRLGVINRGDGVQFRTTVWMPEAIDLHFALAAPMQKCLWINGEAIEHTGTGYLWMPSIRLKAGLNLIEWRLVTEHPAERKSLWNLRRSNVVRAYWALVTDVKKFTRPERMIPSDMPVKDSRLVYSLDFDAPFTPVESTIHVSAAAPCLVVVNGVEVGRQGDFEPYNIRSRVQRYAVSNFRRGANTVELHVVDMGAGDTEGVGKGIEEPNGHVAVMLDGIVDGVGGETLSIISGAHWQVKRDQNEPTPVSLYRSQWLDPAWTLLWRRPHPLPETNWLDGTSSDDAVLAIAPDALAGQQRVEWFRWTLPPGATAMHLPVAGQYQVWVDGENLTPGGDTIAIPSSDTPNRTVLIRVKPEQGHTGGAIFTDSVSYDLGAGRIKLGNWSQQGLEAYSGGLRYRTEFTLENLPRPLVLDLGHVRGTAEVWVNGNLVGVAVWSPYVFEISQWIQGGVNTVEILVLNTLAPYMDAVSPTHYVRKGQTVSGIMGPVTLRG